MYSSKTLGVVSSGGLSTILVGEDKSESVISMGVDHGWTGGGSQPPEFGGGLSPRFCHVAKL